MLKDRNRNNNLKMYIPISSPSMPTKQSPKTLLNYLLSLLILTIMIPIIMYNRNTHQLSHSS